MRWAIDASEGLTVDLVAVAGSEDDAKPVANTLQALLTLGKNGVQGMRQDLRGRTAVSGEAMDWLSRRPIPCWTRLVSRPREATCICKRSRPLTWPKESSSLAPAVASANSASRRAESVNNLKQIALAFHNYHSANNYFPTPVLYGGSNKSIPYSWRVAILPYIEQEPLYKQYNFDEPWDGPNNRKLLDKMPAVYSYPGADGGPSSRTTRRISSSPAKGPHSPRPVRPNQANRRMMDSGKITRCHRAERRRARCRLLLTNPTRPLRRSRTSWMAFRTRS